MKTTFLMVFALLAAGIDAQAAFWLRNVDPGSVLYYWTVSGEATVPAEQLLPLLPLAPGGRHGVAPGERVQVTLAPGRFLVATFVPWTENLSFRSTITGSYLLGSEVPAKGTLQISQNLIASVHRERLIQAPLQQWGLTVPQFVLSGSGAAWSKVRPATEWGSSFLPGNQPWPKAWPKPQVLQAADREGALWVRLQSAGPWTGLGQASVSLVLRRPGSFLEWPLTGTDGTVWLWRNGEASPVGWRVLRGADLESWVPWDRLDAEEKALWQTSRLVWSLIVADSTGTRTLDLGTTAAAEWP